MTIEIRTAAASLDTAQPKGEEMMRVLKGGVLALMIGAVAVFSIPARESGAVQIGSPRTLGAFPLCEASSAVWMGGNRLIVGDNEVRDRLFSFPLDGGELDPASGDDLSLGDAVEISDIEALAGLESGEIVAFGSHSRNTRCRARGNRRQFLRGTATGNGFVASSDGVIQADEKLSCERLFGDIPQSNALLAAVCSRIDEVEASAEDIWDSNDSDEAKIAACNSAQPYNAEGAMAIAAGSGEELWIGLRSPLLPSASADAGSDLAILLRMEGLDAYTFDDAALLDLDGGGIRELTVANGWVLGISGPPEDSSVGFRLWMFPVEELEPGATIRPTFFESPMLPTSSEGLAVVGSTAHVIIDGDQGGGPCAAPARYLAVPLPR